MSSSPATAVETIAPDINLNLMPLPHPTEIPDFVMAELPSNTREAIGTYRKYLAELEQKPVKEGSVAVVIPAHNEATTIEATLNSLENLPKETQNSVIISLNGCTDNTMEIVERWCREHGITPNIINIDEQGNVHHQEETSPETLFTIINRSVSRGKLQALLDAQILFEEQGHLPEAIFSLDADTKIAPGYVKTLWDKYKDDTRFVAVSGKVHFENENNEPVGAFANSVNSIHGNPDLGGNWIPGASALWNARSLIAGYGATQKYFPGIQVEDAAMGLLTNLAGFRTKVLTDTPFITLPTNDKGKAEEQMRRWLEGAVQLEEIFGKSVLSDLGMEAPLTRIIKERVKEVLSNANTLQELGTAIQTIAKELPFAITYLSETRGARRNTPPTTNRTHYTWSTDRIGASSAV